jgi:hypothetical protein
VSPRLPTSPVVQEAAIIQSMTLSPTRRSRRDVLSA